MGISGNKYQSRGFFPIMRPPEDSTRIIPPHIHPLRAHAVEGFRLTGLDSAHASFAWDSIPPSDWGQVGVNVNAYQVNYAPYGQEYDEADTVIVTGTLQSAQQTPVRHPRHDGVGRLEP